jgi:hypothetical protein
VINLLLATLITLAWDANPSSDQVDHYNLKWGYVMGQQNHVINVGNVTTHSIDEPWPIGSTVYFVVTAVNIVDLESGPSNEVSFTVNPWNPNAPGHLQIINVQK